MAAKSKGDFFILPPSGSSGGAFSQFAGGVAEGLGDDLPQLLNQFFTQKGLNNLQTALGELGEDAAVLDKISIIDRSKISEDNKKLLSQQARTQGLQNILKDMDEGKHISHERIINQIGDTQTVNALLAIQKRQKEGEKTEAQFTKDKLASRDKTLKEVKNLLGAETWDQMPVQDKLDVIDFHDKAYDQTLDPLKSLNLVLDRYRDVAGEKAAEEKSAFRPIGSEVVDLGKKAWEKLLQTTSGKKAVDAASKGWDNSIAGRQAAISRGETASEYEKSVALPKNASVLDRAIYGISSMLANGAYHAAGAKIGGMAGGGAATLTGVPAMVPIGTSVVGAGGFLALPAMVDTAQRLYHEYLEGGGDASFIGFLDAAAETVQSGVDSGLEGVILGIVSKYAPLLRKMPIFRKLFDAKGIKGKISETLVTGTLETASILGSRVVSGQKVSVEDAEDLSVLIFGFNAYNKFSPKLKKALTNKIEKSEIEPADFLENVKVRLENQNQDPANPREFTRAVNDVSKDYSKAKEVFKQAEKPEVGREQLEKRREEKVKLAERISEEPIDEMLKEKKPTKKVKEAMDVVEGTEREIAQQRKNIESLETGLGKAKPQQKKLREQGIKLAEQEIGKLEKRLETEKINIEEAKPAKRVQTEEQLAQQISRHNEKLDQISKDPGGALSKEWQGMFERDKKYSRELKERSGELPSPEHVGTGVRILENYLKAYKNLLKSVEKQIKDLIGPKTAKLRGAKQKQYAKDLVTLQKNIKKNIKINEAKQNLRKRKRYVKELAEGKGNAYLKQLVKNLETTTKGFQKDFIKVKKIMDSPEAKVAKVAKLGQEGIQKATSEFVKNPTKEAAVKFEEKTGIPKEEAKKAVETGEKAGKKIVEKIKSGESIEPSDLKQFVAELKNKIDKLPPIQKMIVGSLIFGSLQFAVESSLGVKPSIRLVAAALPGGFWVKFSAAAMLHFGTLILKDQQEKYWKRQIKKAPTFQAKSNIRSKLRAKDWSPARIKKLRS